MCSYNKISLGKINKFFFPNCHNPPPPQNYPVYSLKKITYEWTQAVQTHVVQKQTVYEVHQCIIAKKYLVLISYSFGKHTSLFKNTLK